MSEPDSAIQIDDLVVGFGRHVVIDHLSLTVRRGETMGLVGASGGGKSVLMRAMIGLLPKRSGEIRIDPQIERRPVSRLGVLFQQGALFSSLNARQNVQFPLRENVNISDELLDEIANAKLEMVGLTAADGEKFPSELSGGMTKRLRARLRWIRRSCFSMNPRRGSTPSLRVSSTLLSPCCRRRST
jgi:phospholipid/cholesterol/gamma-HCH transport system ATP-binding protein